MKQKTGKNNQNEIKKAQEELKEILAAFEESEKHCSEAIKLWMQIDPTIKEKIDSLNALVRTPEYQKDIEELESFEWDEETFGPKDNEGYEKKHNEIMNKYNIFDVIFNKKDGSPDLLSYYSPEVFQDKSVVVLENEKFKDLRDEKGKLIGTDISPHLFENKYLMLQVDLTKKLQEIIKAFKETIKSYRKYVVRKTPRDKSYTTDIWSIYDKSTQKKYLK